MGVIVRLTTSAAGYLKKEAERLGRTLLADGGGTKHRIRDGFILRAVRAGENAIVTILDLPRFFGGPLYFPVSGSGVTSMVTAKVPDALKLLTPSAVPGAPHTAGGLGFYAADGLVSVGGFNPAQSKRIGPFMQAPLNVCRTALLSGFAPQLYTTGATEGYTVRVVRLNGATKWEETAPVGIAADAPTMSEAAFISGAGSLPGIEFSTTALSIPTLSPPQQILVGPCLEAGALRGIVSAAGWFANSFGGLVPDYRFVVARYTLTATEEPGFTGSVAWSTSVMSSSTPVGTQRHVMYAPQTWGVWSTMASASVPADQPLPPTIAVVSGCFVREVDDPEIAPLKGAAVSNYTLFLSISSETGAVTQSTLWSFDSWQLNYTELEDHEYTPVATYSVDDQPFIMCAIRRVGYHVEQAGNEIDPDRKRIDLDAVYTKLSDITHVILNNSGVPTTVNLGAYYIAYGSKYIDPVVSGTGRAYFTGYHTFQRDTGIGAGGPPTGSLAGLYLPHDLGSFSYGGSPLYRSVCLYAPGILVAVVSPSGQYLASAQDRYLMLLDAVTGSVLQVGTTPLTANQFAIAMPHQLACLEQGSVDEEGALTRHGVLIITIPNETLGGVFITRDLGATMTKIMTGPLGTNVHYLGSPLGGVALGDTTGIPVLKPPPILA